MAYGWIITEDHLAEDLNEILSDGYESDKGVQGPSDIPPHLEEALKAGKGHTFRMYDDDGELYYKGKAVWDADDEGTEEACYGPLGDFGMPNAGCTLIKWHGRSEWDCG